MMANMKTGRWASGEMQGAVEKRRTTLANKKAERAASSNLNASTADTTNSAAANTGQAAGSAAPSGSTTPASLAGRPGSLPPIQDSVPLQSTAGQSSHSAGILQQPPAGYALPPGGPSGPAT